VTSVSPEEYEQVYWPQIRGIVIKLLNLNPGELSSFEEISRLVFTICWNQHHQRLLDDLLILVKSHLGFLCVHLEAIADNQKMFLAVGEALEKFKTGCNCIASGLSHLVSF
jgi:hypothetical protein